MTAHIKFNHKILLAAALVVIAAIVCFILSSYHAGNHIDTLEHHSALCTEISASAEYPSQAISGLLNECGNRQKQENEKACDGYLPASRENPVRA